MRIRLSVDHRQVLQRIRERPGYNCASWDRRQRRTIQVLRNRGLVRWSCQWGGWVDVARDDDEARQQKLQWHPAPGNAATAKNFAP
jgi:hypothetical protein